MKCLICNKEFDKRISLERHITVSYGKEKEQKHFPLLVYRYLYEHDTRFCKDALQKMYKDGWSTPRMSKELGVNKKTLLDTMHYYGINFRDASQQGKNRAKVLGVWNDGLTKFDHPSIMKYAKDREGKNNPYFTAPNFDARYKTSCDNVKYLINSSPSRNPKTTEMRAVKIFTAAGISYKRNFCLKRKDKRWRLFDFLIEGKILLELQGDYWHANPRFYKANDRIAVRKSRKDGSLSKEIWKYDEEKKQLALSHNYQFVSLWESDMKAMSDAEILDVIWQFLSKKCVNE